MPKVKFGINGEGVEGGGNFYDGPPPPAGTYTGKLKRLELTKTSGGPNAKLPKGTPMMRILVEITGPKSAKKYHGAGLFRQIPIAESTAGFVNQFLAAITDGSETAVKRIQKVFWGEGPFINDEGHFVKIGTTKIGSPEGEREVVIQTKLRKYEGETKAEIARFLTKQSDEADDMTDEDADADDDDLDVDVDEDEVDDDEDADEDEDDSDDEDEDEEDSDESDDEDDEDEDEEPVTSKKSKKEAPF